MTKYYGNKKIDNLTDAIKALRKSPLFSETTEEVDMFMDALQSKSEQLEQENERLKEDRKDSQTANEVITDWGEGKKKYNDLIERAKEMYDDYNKRRYIDELASDGAYTIEQLFGEELNPKEGE